jgi:hypothetical protein
VIQGERRAGGVGRGVVGAAVDRLARRGRDRALMATQWDTTWPARVTSTVQTFRQLQQRVDDQSRGLGTMAFRGYASADPRPDALITGPEGLITGLERACHFTDGGLSRAAAREHSIMREFIRRAHHYLPRSPKCTTESNGWHSCNITERPLDCSTGLTPFTSLRISRSLRPIGRSPRI